jgi:hypothetical protein
MDTEVTSAQQPDQFEEAIKKQARELMHQLVMQEIEGQDDDMRVLVTTRGCIDTVVDEFHLRRLLKDGARPLGFVLVGPTTHEEMYITVKPMGGEPWPDITIPLGGVEVLVRQIKASFLYGARSSPD